MLMTISMTNPNEPQLGLNPLAFKKGVFVEHPFSLESVILNQRIADPSAMRFS